MEQSTTHNLGQKLLRQSRTYFLLQLFLLKNVPLTMLRDCEPTLPSGPKTTLKGREGDKYIRVYKFCYRKKLSQQFLFYGNHSR